MLDRFCNEQVNFTELEIGETGQEADKCYLEAQSGLDRKVLEKVVLVGKQRVTQNNKPVKKFCRKQRNSSGRQ